MSTSMNPSAVAMVNRQLEELRQQRDGVDQHGSASGSPDRQGAGSGYYASKQHHGTEEIQAVLSELREAKAALIAATRALEKEKQAHAKTKELLHLALKPSDQTPSSFINHPGLKELSREQREIAAAAALPLGYDKELEQQRMSQSPWRRDPRISPTRPMASSRRGDVRYGYNATSEVNPGSGAPPVAESSPLQELLVKAASSNTPRKTAAETRRAVHELCGVHDRHGNKKDAAAFGSKSPRFQGVTLQGDHYMYQSNIPTGWGDDDGHHQGNRSAVGMRTPRGTNTPRRTVSPASSRRATPRGTPRGAGNATTPTPLRAPGHKLQAASPALNESAVRNAAAEATRKEDETAAALPDPTHALRSPDVSHWVSSVMTPGSTQKTAGGGLQYTLS